MSSTSSSTKPATHTLAESLDQIHALLDHVLSASTSHDMLELAMATVISQRVVPDGPPVWLLFEGPPSSGKTALVSLLKELSTGLDRLTVFAPKITLGSLTSGFKDPKNGKRAPALLKEFDTRCWCNTEFSTLLTGDAKSVSPILGVLTAAFDGDLASAFGNVVEQASAILDLKSRFSVLGCITPQVRQEHTRLLSQLGPRFLSYRLPSLTDDEERRAFALVQDPQRAARIKALQALIGTHVHRVLNEPCAVEIPEEADAILQALARLIAAGRTPVLHEDRESRAEGGEDPIRVYQQLRALLTGLARLHGTSTPSARALRLVRDVALSSFEPRRAETLLVQRTNPVLAFRYPPAEGKPVVYLHGMTAPQLAEVTGWSLSTAERALQDLCALGLYASADSDLVRAEEPQPGQAAVLYVPVPGLSCVLNATFEDYPPELVTLPELARAKDGAFDGHLSTPDARLASQVAERRAERDRRIRESVERLRRDRPDLDDEELPLMVIRDVFGVSLTGPDRADPPPRPEGQAPIVPKQFESIWSGKP